MAIDDSGTINAPGTVTGPFAHGADLIAMLATDPDVEACFWRHFADYAAATSDTGLENNVLAYWATQPTTTQKSIHDMFVAFARSDFFVQRSAR